MVGEAASHTNRGRILVCKVGLDGHDRGGKLLARMLSDEGFEVHYLGVRSSIGHVAEVAQERDVDVVAVSLLSGAQISVARTLKKALEDKGLGHVALAMGGLIPERDVQALLEIGVAQVFCRGRPENSPQGIPLAIDTLVSLARSVDVSGAGACH